MRMIYFIIIFTMLLGGCTMQNKVEDLNLTYQTITAQEANERLNQDKDIIILDVRTKEEYAQIHITNSVLIPVDVLKNNSQAQLTNKDATIFIYCRSGRRSITAAEILVELGYTNVYNIGGIIDWEFDTESGEWSE